MIQKHYFWTCWFFLFLCGEWLNGAPRWTAHVGSCGWHDGWPYKAAGSLSPCVTSYPSRSRVTKRGLSGPFSYCVLQNPPKIGGELPLAYPRSWVVLVWRTGPSFRRYSSSRRLSKLTYCLIVYIKKMDKVSAFMKILVQPALYLLVLVNFCQCNTFLKFWKTRPSLAKPKILC
jgi:hypothetical protein